MSVLDDLQIIARRADRAWEVEICEEAVKEITRLRAELMDARNKLRTWEKYSEVSAMSCGDLADDIDAALNVEQ